MAMVAVNLWHNGLSIDHMLQRVHYNAGGYVPPSLLGWTNITDNIPLLSEEEVFNRDEIGYNNKQLMLRQEQK